MSEFPRVSIAWTDDNIPLDRYGRTSDECREHAADVQLFIDEVRGLVQRMESAGLPREREIGTKFGKRWGVQLAAMQRVLDRDLRNARFLEAAAAQEAERRAL